MEFTLKELDLIDTAVTLYIQNLAMNRTGTENTIKQCALGNAIINKIEKTAVYV